MLRISLLKVESPQSMGFFAIFSFLSGKKKKKRVLEPELENKHIRISVHRPLLAFPITLAPAKGLSCYL